MEMFFVMDNFDGNKYFKFVVNVLNDLFEVVFFKYINNFIVI